MTTRRELLARTALLLGGALSPGWAIAAHTHSVSSGGRIAYGIRTLNVRQNQFITAIADVIVPETTTPGASGAKVNEFIDMLLTDWYSAGERVLFLDGIDELDRHCKEHAGKPFSQLDPQQQLEIVDRLDAEAVAARASDAAQLPVFALIKELTLVGYYTSEVGMTRELNTLGPVGVADFGAEGPPTGLPRYTDP
jgi:hypothetical protein